MVRIAFSQLDGSKKTLNDSASWVVDDWEDQSDLVAAMAGSAYIPCLSGRSTYTIFRNQPVIDGGYGNGFEDFCPGGDVSACLKLGTWYVGPLGNATCDPEHCDCTKGPDPERTDRVKTLYKNPYVDRSVLYKVFDLCPPSNDPNNTFADYDPYPLPDFVPQYSTIPDIYPGKYNPLPTYQGRTLHVCEWQRWAMDPPQDGGVGGVIERMNLIYELGYADARAYLAQEKNITIAASSA